MKLLLDTNVIVPFFIPEEHTPFAQKIFDEIFEYKIQGYITPLIFVEICGVISRRTNPEKAKFVYEEIQKWLSYGIITIIPQTPLIISRAYHFALQHQLKGADALIVATADVYKLQLATLDKEVRERIKAKISLY